MAEHSAFTIRRAEPRDTAAMVEIYRPSIEDTSVSFELQVPTVEEFAARVAESQAKHEWLVACAGDEVLGYAYGGTHRAREAYRFTVEVSAYVAAHGQRRGVASALYSRLFECLIELGYCNAVAGVTMPNDRSAAFHERMGFTKVGVYHRIGYKFGRWCDVAWYERTLCEGSPPS